MGAQMNDKNRALCFAFRNPPAGVKKLSYAKIAKRVATTLITSTRRSMSNAF